MKEILHIVPDDKFVDFIISDFNRRANVNNRYIHLVDSDLSVKDLVFIGANTDVEVVCTKSLKYKEILNEHSVDVIVFHSLGKDVMKQFLRDIRKCVLIYWISWGYDYVRLINLNQFKPKTQELYNQTVLVKCHIESKKHSLFRNDFTRFIRRCFFRLLQLPNTFINWLKLVALYKKIDYCSCVVPNEFESLKKIPGFRAKYLPYKIGFVTSPFKDIDKFYMLGNSIWVGNSYTFSNNHLDIFFQLKEFGVDNEIIVPLSYGLSVMEYPELIDIGHELFGKSFIPILEYMSFDEYNLLLKKSYVAIFNHVRQQALGNILMMIWQGTKVFLCNQSPIYTFLLQRKFTIFSVEDNLSVVNLNVRLTEKQIMDNRILILKYFSPEVIDRENSESVQILLNNVKN